MMMQATADRQATATAPPIPPSYITAVSVNVNGWNEERAHQIQDSSVIPHPMPAIIILQETHHQPHHPPTLPGYHTFHKEGVVAVSPHGRQTWTQGHAILVKHRLAEFFSPVFNLPISPSSSRFFAIRTKSHMRPPVTITSVYGPSSPSNIQQLQFLNDLAGALPFMPSPVLAGDWNMKKGLGEAGADSFVPWAHGHSLDILPPCNTPTFVSESIETGAVLAESRIDHVLAPRGAVQALPTTSPSNSSSGPLHSSLPPSHHPLFSPPLPHGTSPRS